MLFFYFDSVISERVGKGVVKFEDDRPRQCLFAGTTNTKQFLPFDRTGARRFLAIEVDSSKAEKHLLDNEEESRAYFDQLWAEAMVIFNSCKGFPGIAENDSCIWNVIEFIFITIHIKFPTANGHEVDFGIRSF